MCVAQCRLQSNAILTATLQRLCIDVCTLPCLLTPSMVTKSVLYASIMQDLVLYCTVMLYTCFLWCVALRGDSLGKT